MVTCGDGITVKGKEDESIFFLYPERWLVCRKLTLTGTADRSKDRRIVRADLHPAVFSLTLLQPAGDGDLREVARISPDPIRGDVPNRL